MKFLSGLPTDEIAPPLRRTFPPEPPAYIPVEDDEEAGLWQALAAFRQSEQESK